MKLIDNFPNLSFQLCKTLDSDWSKPIRLLTIGNIGNARGRMTSDGEFSSFQRAGSSVIFTCPISSYLIGCMAAMLSIKKKKHSPSWATRGKKVKIKVSHDGSWLSWFTKKISAFRAGSFQHEHYDWPCLVQKFKRSEFSICLLTSQYVD